MDFNLVLGTAQLDESYSLSKKKLKDNDLFKILDSAKKNKQFFIDTALGYKNSEKVLSKYNLEKFKVITKIKKLNKDSINQLLKSKKNLKIKSFYCVMFHDEDELLRMSKNNFEIFLNNLKKNKISFKIGVSLYKSSSVNPLFKKFKFNMVQIPINLFDRRFLKQKIVNKFKNQKIKIFIRSIFLKGLLINDKLKNKNEFNSLNKNFKKYDSWIAKNKISNLKQICISFILKNQLKNLVIGFDSFKEYIEITKLKKIYHKKIPNFVENQSDNNKILRPDLWKNETKN